MPSHVILLRFYQLTVPKLRHQLWWPMCRTLCQMLRAGTSRVCRIVSVVTHQLSSTWRKELYHRMRRLRESWYWQFTLTEGILYYVEPADKTLRVIPPNPDCYRLFCEVHEGPFSGHLREAKIYGKLSRHYWWPGMRREVTLWCRACITCATRSVGRPLKPLLVPIPVHGPFDRVGVDVVQLPKLVVAVEDLKRVHGPTAAGLAPHAGSQASQRTTWIWSAQSGLE